MAENANQITCPKCGERFNAEQALSLQVETRLRTEFNQKFKGLSAQKEMELSQRLAEEMKKQAEQQKKLEIDLREKVKLDFEAQLKNSNEELEAKRKEVYALKGRELELLKVEQQLLEQKQSFELDLQKKLMEERKVIEENAKQKAEADSLFKLREKDMKMAQLMEQIEVMKKKAEQGSMQLQGEVQELALEELLQSTFPFDIISEVGKGVKGADIIQAVHNKLGQECGSIIYESKRTKAFSNEWIDKLKSDLRSQKSDIAVIVTGTMPREMDKFGQKDGIWICSYEEVKGVAAVLRESLIRIHEIKASQDNKGDKMQFLYDFLTGNEFRHHIESIVEGFSCMQTSLQKERLAMERMWSEREKQLNKVLVNMSGMYGSIKGIAGNAVAEVKLLSLDE